MVENELFWEYKKKSYCSSFFFTLQLIQDYALKNS